LSMWGRAFLWPMAERHFSGSTGSRRAAEAQRGGAACLEVPGVLAVYPGESVGRQC